MRIPGNLSGKFGEFEFRRVLDWTFAVLVYLAVNHGSELMGVLKTADGWRSLASGLAVIAGRGVYVYWRDFSKRQEVT